jgi:hypothetical protein
MYYLYLSKLIKIKSQYVIHGKIISLIIVINNLNDPQSFGSVTLLHCRAFKVNPKMLLSLIQNKYVFKILHYV